MGFTGKKNPVCQEYSNLTVTHFSQAGSLAESLKWQDARIELLGTNTFPVHHDQQQ